MRSRAQSFSEYTICVAVIVIATIVMQSYIRRGLQGRYVDLASQATAMATGSDDVQYEPYYIDEDYTTGMAKDINPNIQGEGRQVTTINQDLNTRSGRSIQGVSAYDDE